MKLVVDTHTHTIASGHAFGTVQEMALAAYWKGLEAVALTEHGPAMEGAPVPLYFAASFMLPKRISGVTVLRGVEANIIDYDGGLDLEDRILEGLDFVMAGFHDIVLEPCGDVEANTRALIRVLEHPLVDAVSHPGNPVFRIDVDRVVAAAKEHGKLLEINNNSVKVRRGSRENCERIAAACASAGIPVVVGSDAHTSFDVGGFEDALSILESVSFPEALVLNTSLRKLAAHLTALRPRRFAS